MPSDSLSTQINYKKINDIDNMDVSGDDINIKKIVRTSTHKIAPGKEDDRRGRASEAVG